MTDTEGLVDRDALEARRLLILAEHYQLVGRLRELDYWLAQLDQEEAPSSPPGEPPAIHSVPPQEEPG